MFSRKFKALSKVVAVVMTIGLFFTGFNGNIGLLLSTAYASPTQAEIENKESSSMTDLELAQMLDEPVKVESESDEYTNVYQNPDGTKTADFFGSPVNYYDENEQLQKIESNIVHADAEQQAQGVKYTNKSGLVSVQLPEDVVSENPVRIKHDKYTIEMYPIGKVSYAMAAPHATTTTTPSPESTVTTTPEAKAEKDTLQPEETQAATSTQKLIKEPAQTPTQTALQTAVPTEAPKLKVPDKYKGTEIIETFDQKGNVVEFSSQQKKQEAIDKYEAIELARTIKYRTGYNDKTYIEYTPTNVGIKEDIVLNEYTGQNSFDFMLDVGVLVPEITETMDIRLIDPATEKLVSVVSAPYMHDSFEGEILEETGDHISEAVTYTLKETEVKGQYILTVTADKAFLEDKDTVYPVTIDPTTVFETTGTEVGDTFVTSQYPNNTYGADTYLRLGLSGDFGTSRGYVRFPTIRDVILGRTVVSATLTTYEDYGYTSDATFNIHRVASSFTASTLKWNTPAPNYVSTIYASNNIDASGTYTWNLKNLVQDWVNNTSYHPGFVLKYSDDLDGIGRYRRFRSTEYGGSTGLRLSVTYEDKAAPTLPTSFTATSSFSGATGTVTLKWSGVVDQPKTAGASGIDHFTVAYRKDSEAYTYVDVAGSATSKAITGLLDNSIYDFAIRTCDKNGNWSAYKFLYDVVTPDKTGPIAPTSLTVNPSSWTNDETPTVTWAGITDEGNHLSKIEYRIDSGAWTNTGKTTGSGNYTPDCAALADGTHTISVRGVDSAGNAGAARSANYYLDRTAPAVSIDIPENNDAIKGIAYVTASVARNDSFSAFDDWTLEYGYGTNPASYIPLVSGATEVDNAVIYAWDTTELVENAHYSLRLRAKDQVGNEGTIAITVLKSEDSDSVGAGLQIDIPDVYEITEKDVSVEYQKADNGGVDGLSTGKLYVNNALEDDAEEIIGQGLGFDAAAYDAETGWKYPEGSIVFMYVQSKDEVEGEIYSTHTYQALKIADTFESNAKIENLSNTEQADGVVRLTQSQNTGSFESKVKNFAGDVSYLDLVTDQTVEGDGTITYEVSVDGGTTWQSITPVSTDGGTTVEQQNRKYFTEKPVGDSVKLKATLTRPSTGVSPELDLWSIDVRYTTYATAVLVNNTFSERARGVANLVQTDHDQTGESIKLAESGPDAYFTTGSVSSTLRYTSNDTIAACLEATVTSPDGTGITYEISTDGGTTWEPITPGDANVPGDWIDLAHPGTQVVVRANLTGNGTNTPSLDEWKLCIKEKLAGEPHMVKLVDEPDNLSTLTGANYMTLLRWEGSHTADVTYNVYRSTTPYFEPSEATLAAEDITENSWSDYNLNYGTTFYYKVTAVKVIEGHDRESMPSNEAFATVVDENEVQKMLGLQNYWSYGGFETGSGTGYINVANGNMAYITTDMVITGPFFASVMRRTYNTLATTKTPMGYGWDFSFNTCLMKEYDSALHETGMILKDGDGSLHRFAKDGSAYKSAKGTFMALTYNAQEDEWLIKRKDNITYHFDRQSMKLKRFTDRNNNALSFTYDERGNLDTITDTSGEKISLDYYVAGAVPEDPDYTYVNEHPDMIRSIIWTQDTETNPVSLRYDYDYNDADKLTHAKTTIENSVVYQEEFIYDEANVLKKIKDPAGKETDIGYDANGRVNNVTDANDDQYVFGYNDGGTQNRTVLKKVYGADETNEYGPAITYDYDDNGLVKTKTDELGHSINYTHGSTSDNEFLVTGMSYQNYVNGGTTPQTISYSYDYVNGNITRISGPGGAETTYTDYNSFNEPRTINVRKTASGPLLTTTYTYDSHGNPATATDPEEKTTTTVYGTVSGAPGDGYLIKKINNFGMETRYSYNGGGRVTAEKEYDADGNLVRTVSAYTYDAYGRTDTVTDGMGNVTDMQYDILGRQTRVAYPNGKTESFVYDIVGNLTCFTDRKGHETRYEEYDNINRLTRVKYPDGSTNGVAYEEWDSTPSIPGNDALKVVKADGEGVQQIEYYDIAGRLIKTSVDGPSVPELTTAQYQYDLMGNCTQVTDGAGRATKIKYDALGRKTNTTAINDDPDDPSTPNVDEGQDFSTSCTYDLLGNVLTETDGEGSTISYAYDDISRLKTVVQGSSRTTYDYDDIEEAGVIKNKTTSWLSANKGNVTEAWFDEMGRKVKDINLGDTSDGDNTATERIKTDYTYNANNQPHIATRNDGTKEKYTYNSLGLVERIDYYADGANTNVNSSDYVFYDYDENGKVKLESEYHNGSDESTSYGYDSMGRVRQMVQGSLDEGGISITYTYNRADQVTAIEYSKNKVPLAGNEQEETDVTILRYVYDGYGRISQIRLSEDELDQTGTLVRAYAYTPNGELEYTKDYREFLNDGDSYIKTAYERNGAGITDKITYTDHENGSESGVTKEQYTYTFDGRGFVDSEKAYTNYGTAGTVNKSYEYDDVGQLTKATIGNKTKTYTYDAVGNRLTMTESGTTYTYQYNQFNQLESIKKGSDADYARYQYDTLGNQRHEYIKKDFDGTTKEQHTEYTYNLLNRLTTATITAPGETTQNVISAYNAAGKRISKEEYEGATVEDKDTTLYYYTGDEVLFTTTDAAFMLTENILDPKGSIIASKRFEDPYDGNYYFYNYDLRGSVTSIIVPTDITVPGGTTLQGGSRVTDYTYDEFGNLEKGGVQEFLNETTYTGSVSDTSTGLQYMNARYYDPETGRFLTQDTYTGNPYDPWTQHLYAYCGNNPTSMVDPTGHNPEAAAEIYRVGVDVSKIFPLAGIGLILLAGGAALIDIISGQAQSQVSSNMPWMDSYLGTLKRQNAERAAKDALMKAVTAATTAAVAVQEATRKDKEPTKIYRWGSHTNSNLTPRPKKDYKGLSFTTELPKGRNYVMTTIEKVNSTGVLLAIKDGPEHVSIVPSDFSKMVEWIASHPNAETNPHPYTIILKGITEKGVKVK